MAGSSIVPNVTEWAVFLGYCSIRPTLRKAAGVGIKSPRIIDPKLIRPEHQLTKRFLSDHLPGGGAISVGRLLALFVGSVVD